MQRILHFDKLVDLQSSSLKIILPISHSEKMNHRQTYEK